MNTTEKGSNPTKVVKPNERRVVQPPRRIPSPSDNGSEPGCLKKLSIGPVIIMFF